MIILVYDHDVSFGHYIYLERPSTYCPAVLLDTSPENEEVVLETLQDITICSNRSLYDMVFCQKIQSNRQKQDP